MWLDMGVAFAVVLPNGDIGIVMVLMDSDLHTVIRFSGHTASLTKAHGTCVAGLWLAVVSFST